MTGVNQSNLAQMSLSELDKVCRDISEFGFTAVRFAADWAWLSNFLGAVNYQPLHRVRSVLHYYGLTPLPVLGCHLPLFNNSPQQFGAFTKRVIDMFGEIPAYEVWNEPNLWAFFNNSPAAFLKYLRAATPHIRAAGSQSIHGGLAAYPNHQFLWLRNYSPETWLKGLYDAGENNDYDLLGYHPYPLTEQEKFAAPSSRPFGVSQIGAMNNLRSSRGDFRPYSFTEVGYDINKVSLARASEYIAEQFTDLSAAKWVFCWRDTKGDGGNYGLVDARGIPKEPYFSAVKGLI